MPAKESQALGEWEQLALARNPALAVATADVMAARGRAVQAGLYPNPMVGYMADEIGEEGKAGMQGAFVRQEIVRGGKLQLSRAVALREVEEACRKRDAVMQRILTDVRMSFYRVAAAQQRRDLNQRLADLARESSQSIGRLVPMQASQADLLQAQIEAEQAQVNLALATNAHVAAWRQLAAVSGVPDAEMQTVDAVLEQSPPDIAWDDAIVQVLEENPLVDAARARVRRGAAATARAVVEPIPNIHAQVSVQYNAASTDTVTGVEIGVPLPLFNRNQGAIAEAMAQTTSAQRDLERLQLQLRQKLAAAYKDYSSGLAQVRAYDQEILPKSRQSLKLVSDGFPQQVGYTVLLTAQRTYFQAELARLEAMEKLWEAAQRMQGLLLEDSLGPMP